MLPKNTQKKLTRRRLSSPRGGVVRADPIKPKLKAPGTKRFKVKCD